MKSKSYPFAAIVGQHPLKQALLLCAIDPSLGGVLIRGDKGSAKSTAARALADILPAIDRADGCRFNCDPREPHPDCECHSLADVPIRLVPTPFITLPLGATEDRVIGTLDVEQVLRGAKRAFQPGLLAAAHRGVLYVDEVNLLADHLVDVLLDAAAMGMNAVQREGLSVTHPSRFTLIGTMNLEEGDLRPQLLDRFGLMVEVATPRDPSERAEVVRRRMAFETDAETFAAGWSEQQQALRLRIADAQRRLNKVVVSDAMLALITHLCCQLDITSLRADVAMYKASRALAALAGRGDVVPDDVEQAATLALPHRRRRQPFEPSGLEPDKLSQLIRQATKQEAPQTPSASPSDDDRPGADTGDEPSQVFGAAVATEAPTIRVVDMKSPARAGRRGEAYDVPRGRVRRAVPNEHPTSLAVGATLRSAALRNPTATKVERQDLHEQIRVGRASNLILFIVDASGSMAAQRRMEALKGAVLALLTDAYQCRDDVAVIAFRGQSAELLLAPTRSAESAEQQLRKLPTGGRTPLAHALQRAHDLVSQRRRANQAAPLLVLLTDGKANVPLAADGDSWKDSVGLAAQLAALGAPALVIDTETDYLRLGRARLLAQSLGAQYLALDDMSSERLVLAVRDFKA